MCQPSYHFLILPFPNICSYRFCLPPQHYHPPCPPKRFSTFPQTVISKCTSAHLLPLLITYIAITITSRKSNWILNTMSLINMDFFWIRYKLMTRVEKMMVYCPLPQLSFSFRNQVPSKFLFHPLFCWQQVFMSPSCYLHYPTPSFIRESSSVYSALTTS